MSVPARTLIGYVNVESGNLLIVDPCAARKVADAGHKALFGRESTPPDPPKGPGPDVTPLPVVRAATGHRKPHPAGRHLFWPSEKRPDGEDKTMKMAALVVDCFGGDGCFPVYLEWDDKPAARPRTTGQRNLPARLVVDFAAEWPDEADWQARVEKGAEAGPPREDPDAH